MDLITVRYWVNVWVVEVVPCSYISLISKKQIVWLIYQKGKIK